MRPGDSAGLAGTGSPALRAERRDPGRHVARRQQAGVVGVERSPTGVAIAAAASSSSRQVDRVPGPLPGAHRLTQQPQPHHVLQIADPAVDPALVGEVGRPALLGQHRCVQLHADQRPGAGGDVGRVIGRPSARRPPPTPCRASRRPPHRAADGAEIGRRRPRAAGRCADPGRRSRRQQAARQPEVGRSGRVPLTGCGRPADRWSRRWSLGDPLAGQPVRQQVRDEQRPRRRRPADRASASTASW